MVELATSVLETIRKFRGMTQGEDDLGIPRMAGAWVKFVANQLDLMLNHLMLSPSEKKLLETAKKSASICQNLYEKYVVEYHAMIAATDQEKSTYYVGQILEGTWRNTPDLSFTENQINAVFTHRNNAVKLAQMYTNRLEKILDVMEIIVVKSQNFDAKDWQKKLRELGNDINALASQAHGKELTQKGLVASLDALLQRVNSLFAALLPLVKDVYRKDTVSYLFKETVSRLESLQNRVETASVEQIDGSNVWEILAELGQIAMPQAGAALILDSYQFRPLRNVRYRF